jgi:hypothetical protein
MFGNIAERKPASATCCTRSGGVDAAVGWPADAASGDGAHELRVVADSEGSGAAAAGKRASKCACIAPLARQRALPVMPVLSGFLPSGGGVVHTAPDHRNPDAGADEEVQNRVELAADSRLLHPTGSDW